MVSERNILHVSRSWDEYLQFSRVPFTPQKICELFAENYRKVLFDFNNEPTSLQQKNAHSFIHKNNYTYNKTLSFTALRTHSWTLLLELRLSKLRTRFPPNLFSSYPYTSLFFLKLMLMIYFTIPLISKKL